MSLNWRRSSLLILLLLLLLRLSLSNSRPPILDFPCKPPHDSYPFCNKSLSIAERADSIVSLLTLHEKILQIADNASSVPRLGIPFYEWWSEGLHGLAHNSPGVSFHNGGPITQATGFPQVLTSAATFNRTLWFLMASATAIEARAMYNYGQSGLTFWAPNINLFRDPRWGRGQETPGEDPLLVSAYAVEFVKGFQGGNWKDGRSGRYGTGERRVLVEDGEGDDDRLMLSACCKHFTAYDLDKWGNYTRYSFNAVVTEQDMEDTYLPPFRSCVEEGKASCLMCSYNEINGVPACARGDLLQKVRTEWGLKGYITGDFDGMANIFYTYDVIKTPEDAVAVAIKAGVDLNCQFWALLYGEPAVKKGRMQEADVDRALRNLFSVQLRLGLFDGDPRKGKYGKLGPQNVCSKEHKELALDAARQGIVLLKNDNKFLPLDKKAVSSLAIIGPLANNSDILGGDYEVYSCNPRSLLEGFKGYIKNTSYAVGCLDVACDSDARFQAAIHVAKGADFVIIVAGLDLTQEFEDLDRVSLMLPGKQMSLISSIAAASKKPVILLLTGGGPLDVSPAVENPRIASILWIGYPGEAGPKALAEIIFGEYNPGGRLPMTWYPESFTRVPMNDMNMRADPSRGFPGRTYRFYTGNHVYGFGAGLSYTNFSYKILSAPSKLGVLGSLSATARGRALRRSGESLNYVHIDEITSCDSLRFYVQISVSNHGDMDGSHVVMLFSRVPKVFKGTPEKQLAGFERVHTFSYRTAETSILVDSCKHLSFANEHGKMILPLGDHFLLLGDLQHSFTIDLY